MRKPFLGYENFPRAMCEVADESFFLTHFALCPFSQLFEIFFDIFLLWIKYPSAQKTGQQSMIKISTRRPKKCDKNGRFLA